MSRKPKLDFEKLKSVLPTLHGNLTKLTDGEVLDESTMNETNLILDRLAGACCIFKEEAQNFLIEQPQTCLFIEMLDSGDIKDQQLIDSAYEYLLYLSIDNKRSQDYLWKKMGENLLKSAKELPVSTQTDKILMILNNIYKGGHPECNETLFLNMIVDVWHLAFEQRKCESLTYINGFFKDFLIENKSMVMAYRKLSIQRRVYILNYIIAYIRCGSPDGPIQIKLMEYFAKIFKAKADCILGNSKTIDDNVEAQEAHHLLTVISNATGDNLYDQVYVKDDALFLCAGGMLQSIVSLAKNLNSQFTPMDKLVQVAPGSDIDHTFESEISFELKTLLVRMLGNLMCMNKEFQKHCLDIKLIPTLLECTNLDARNPLIREWSILAIRSACRQCPEIQKLISELTKLGDAPNPLLTELDLQLGALRIDIDDKKTKKN